MPKTLRALFVIVTLALPVRAAFAADICGAGHMRSSLADGGQKLVLNWTGRIDGGMARALSHAFEIHGREVTAVALSLSSCGGSIDEMIAALGELDRIKRTHRLVTVVDQGATCASACIPMFLAGEVRRAAMSSLWFFHRSWRESVTGGVDEVRTQVSDRSFLTRYLEQYYVPAGVSREWLTHLVEMIASSGGYWQTGRDLWEARNGMITETIGDVMPEQIRPIYLAPAPGCTAMCRG
ncbi:MAG TPA: hypothetical protein VFF87_01290 [Hyphomicrobium sp.]|nr:hypothetical protein [Hyphomicrobium sp.]